MTTPSLPCYGTRMQRYAQERVAVVKIQLNSPQGIGKRYKENFNQKQLIFYMKIAGFIS